MKNGKIKVCILGSTGMLGNALSRYFLSKNEYEIQLTYRKISKKFKLDNSIEFDPFLDRPWIVGKHDFIINCIGVIKPFIDDNIQKSIYINSYFPWELSQYCQEKNMALIHITTDCVFSGEKGLYTEKDLHDAKDLYGKTKSLGEPENCMVLRTSIIGEEIHKFSSFISWAKSMKNKEVKGFKNHFWNGITTDQFAKVCDQIIQKDLYKKNKFHIFSEDIVKYKLLEIFDKKWNLNLKIDVIDAEEKVDRRLRTIKELNEKLNIPSLKEMIDKI